MWLGFLFHCQADGCQHCFGCGSVASTCDKNILLLALWVSPYMQLCVGSLFSERQTTFPTLKVDSTKHREKKKVLMTACCVCVGTHVPVHVLLPCALPILSFPVRFITKSGGRPEASKFQQFSCLVLSPSPTKRLATRPSF